MRIVFFAWQGSIHTRRWVSWFADRGHEVHVITCGGGGELAISVVTSEQGGGRYTVHDLGEPMPPKWGYLKKVPAARRLVRRLDPDVVHAHFATSYGLLATLAWRGPFAVTGHGDDLLIAPRTRLLRRVVKRVLRRAGVITVPAAHMAEAVAQLVPKAAQRTHVFQYGVDLPRLASRARAINRTRPADGPLRVVSTRAHMDLYRIDMLIAACAILQERGQDLDIRMAGDGPQREALEAAAEAQLAPGTWRFTGHMEPAGLDELVADADVYVSIASSDGTSLSLLEAMALGVVPVVSDIPANSSWITDPAGGVIVTGDTPADVADAIERAASLDRESVARRNRAIVAERGDYATNMGRMEELLDDLGGVRFERAGRRGQAA